MSRLTATYVWAFLGGLTASATQSFAHQAEPISELDCLTISHSPEVICLTSHLQLLAHPERYEGKYVSFVSALHVEKDNSVILFPSRESMAWRICEDSIAVIGAVDDKLKGVGVTSGDAVRIVGRFTRSADGTSGCAGIGSLRRVSSIDPGA